MNSESPDQTQTSYTRAELADAIDKAHELLHGNHAAAAHAVLHSVGAGLPRVGSGTRDPEVQRLVDEWMAKLEGTGLPCGHRLADLIGGKYAVTKCGACLEARHYKADHDAVQTAAS